MSCLVYVYVTLLGKCDWRNHNREALYSWVEDVFSDIAKCEVQWPVMLISQKIAQVVLIGCTNYWHNCRSGREQILYISQTNPSEYLAVYSVSFQDRDTRSISKNLSFRRKHPRVLDGSDGSDGSLYPLRNRYTLPVAQVTGHISSLPPVLCSRKMVMYMHHQNDKCVTLFAGVAVILQLFTQRVAMFMPFSSRVPQFTSSILVYIRCYSLPRYVQLSDVVTYYNGVFASDTLHAIGYVSPSS